MTDDDHFTRRTVLASLFGTALLALAGCSPSAAEDQEAIAALPASDTASPPMVVYRDAGCGCCIAWAELAQQAGFDVQLVEHDQMMMLKQQLGVPAELASCHTATVGDYVVEGHVPLDQVQKLLAERPSDIRGIAVPGMPIGSPGMEVQGREPEPFHVLAFDRHGTVSIYG